MDELVEEIYRLLRYLCLVESQYQFSAEWLGRNKTYYGAIKALPESERKRLVARHNRHRRAQSPFKLLIVTAANTAGLNF